MKATLLLLLSIFGLCWSLQPGLEYQYRYSGRVASGVIDVRHQFSGAGIQADVTVQVAEDHSAVIKFNQVKVGDFHGDFTCDIRTPLPIEYHHLDEGLQLLQTPFRVTVNGSQVIQFLEVPLSEPAWITNIRKGFVNIFRIMPFGVKDEDIGDRSVHLDFITREDMMTGLCTNRYSVMKLAEEEAAQENHQREDTMEVDAQRDGSSKSRKKGKGRKRSKGRKGQKGSKRSSTDTGRIVPSIDETLWNVVRTLDFDDCETLVTMKGHVHHHTEDLISRSSVGTYLIRGDINNMRIERAVLEGSITIFTQDDHKEHFDTLTNQTVQLKVVRPVQQQLTIDYVTHQINSWHYEVEYDIVNQTHEGVQPSLEQILTGVELTEEIVTEIKGIVNTGIEDLSSRMPRNPTHTNHLVGEMSHVVDAITILNSDQLEEIYKQYVTEYNETSYPHSSIETIEFQKRKLYILKQAMIASGTEPAIYFLLNKMLEQDFRYEDDETVYNFFSQIPMTIKSPSDVPKIMDVVMQMTWDDQENDDKSVALVTFSQLVNKMLLSSERRSAYSDTTTCQQDHICHMESIINTYIPYLQQGLENDESPIWQRLIYLQALSSLGTPHTISILQPYILGTKEAHIAFRKNAIWSLSKPNLHSTAKEKVIGMLMPVFENVAEHQEVRNIAFLVMATWETSVSWWQHMAVSTWHEPSNKVANFISTTIKTTAHMQGGELAKITSRVEHLAKPAAPASITHSVNHYLLDYVYSTEVGCPLTYAWLASSDTLIPSEIYFRLRLTTFLGFTHHLKVSLQQFSFNKIITSLLSSMLSKDETKQVDQDAINLVVEMFNNVKENIKFDPKSETPEMAILLKVQRVFKFVMSINDDVVRRLDYTEFLVHRPGFVNIPHYYRYVDAFVAIPTELGLPFIVKHTAQCAWWLSTSLTLSQSAIPYGAKGSTSVTLDASRMFSVEAKTLIPWSKKFAVGTGSENLISVLLPFKIQHLANMRNYEVQLTLEPIANEKVNLIEAHNLPTTVQYGAFPTTLHYKDNECKTIKKKDDYIYTRETPALPPILVGLSIQSEWTGDIQFPFNLRSFYKGEFNLLTPTLNTWDYHLLYDPEASTTKSISTTLTYVSTDKKTSGELQSLTEDSQSSMTYAEFTQFSPSSSSDYQRFGDVDAFVQEQSPTRQRIAKLQQEVVPAAGGHVRSISIDFNLQGPPSKKYEAVLTWTTGRISSRTHTKIHFTWINNVPDGVSDVPHTTCLVVQLEKPCILPFVTVEEVLNTNFHTTVKADLHDGANCEQPPVLEIEGSLDVSPDQLDNARRKLTEEHCGAESDFLPIDLMTSPLYDHIQFKAQWTEDFPLQLKNLTYFADDMIRGHMFPDLYYDYTVTNTDHKIEVDATKCLKTHHWTIHTTKPNDVSIIKNVEAPYLFNVIASPAKVKDILVYDFLNGRQHHMCIIDHHKIRTFDGLEIPYEPDECWNVVAIDNTGNDVGIIEVRFHDDQWEVRILYPAGGLRLELTKTALKVNGEDFTTGQDDDDRFSVIFLEDASILIIPFFTVSILKISDKVYYVEDQLFRSLVGGVCGNFDGEISADMLGPKGCVYTDPKLFVKSWTTEGEGCSGSTYQHKRTLVEAYQNDCPHNSYIPTGISYPNMLTDCMDWEYQERTEGIYKCKSLILTPKCKAGCVAIHVKSETIQYDCEVTEQTNPHAHQCYHHEYSTTYPGNCLHQ